MGNLTRRSAKPRRERRKSCCLAEAGVRSERLVEPKVRDVQQLLLLVRELLVSLIGCAVPDR